MPDRPRRWRRFVPRLSLRVLMVLVLVLGGGLGWLVHSARTQRQAVAAIEASGGKVVYDWAWTSTPRWLVRWLGSDYFSTAIWVDASQVKQVDDPLMDQVARLEHLQWINFSDVATLTDDHLLKLSGLVDVRNLDLARSGIKGSGLAVVKHFRKLKHLELDSIPISDADLTHLAGLKALEDIHLDATNLTDDGLSRLAGLSNLDRLVLSGGSITSRGLVHLRDLKRLKILILIKTQVTTLEPIRGLTQILELTVNRGKVDNEGLAPVAAWKSLRAVGLRGCPVDDQGLDALLGLTKLSSLNLHSTQITDAGLEKMASLVPNLTDLMIAKTRITDAGLAHLAGATRLDFLDLSDTRITDAGLAHLTGLLACRDLDLTGTDVTQAGVAWLQTKLPLAHIESSAPTPTPTQPTSHP